jgi:hypothetical protein
MAVELPNTGKNTNMRNFTAFQGGVEVYRITQSAGPELRELAQKFPKAIENALFMLGGHVRKRMRRAIDEGGTNTEKWLHLSDMRLYRRMERLKRGEFPRNAYKKFNREGLHARSKDKRSGFGLFGKAARALAFRMVKRESKIEIGALSPSAEHFISAVQEGRRGSKGAFQFTGIQSVTPAMRRALWAAGFPISMKTKVIGQEARPLIPPVFKEMSPEFEQYLIGKTKEFLAGQGIDWGK